MSTELNELRALISRYRLSRRDVATLVGVSPKAVESWFASPGSSSHRRLRGSVLELLRFKLVKGE